MSALALTGRDLAAVLSRGLSVADRHTAEHATRLAEAIGAELGAGGHVETAAVAPCDYRVSATAPGLSGREFGTTARPAEPVIGPAVDRLRAAGRGS